MSAVFAEFRNSTSIAIRALAEEVARTGEPAAADTKRCADRIHAALSAVADSKYEATEAPVLGLATNEGALLLQLTAEEKGRVVQRTKNRSNTSPLPTAAAKCLAFDQVVFINMPVMALSRSRGSGWRSTSARQGSYTGAMCPGYEHTKHTQTGRGPGEKITWPLQRLWQYI
jgi:hypothetical protein